MPGPGDSILRGAREALAYAAGKARPAAGGARVPDDIDVRAIRRALGLSQRQFAARFGFCLGTLRSWEQGLRQPEGPARAYLTVIQRAPAAVEGALRSEGTPGT